MYSKAEANEDKAHTTLLEYQRGDAFTELSRTKRRAKHAGGYPL